MYPSGVLDHVAVPHAQNDQAVSRTDRRGDAQGIGHHFRSVKMADVRLGRVGAYELPERYRSERQVEMVVVAAVRDQAAHLPVEYIGGSAFCPLDLIPPGLVDQFFDAVVGGPWVFGPCDHNFVAFELVHDVQKERPAVTGSIESKF